MSVIGDENIFRLQIPMIDSYGMAILNSIQELEKGVLGQSIITHEMALFGDVGEEIAFRAILHDNIRAFWAIQNPFQGNHVGMLAGLVMKSNLSLLKSSLPGVQSMFGKSLYRVEFVGIDIDGSVDHAVSSNTED